MNSFCGVVALVGESNAGKSRLLNAFLEAPLASVHHKRNLTRERMRAVITQGERQLVIEDTAGLTSGGDKKKSSAREGLRQEGVREGGHNYWARRRREEALSAARIADISLWVVDVARGERALQVAIALAKQAGDEDKLKPKPDSAITEQQTQQHKQLLQRPYFLAFNKIDLVRDKRLLLPLAAQAEASKCFAEVFMLSAKKGDGVARAREHLLQALPKACFLYQQEGDTRAPETIACEITRTVIYDHLHAELPYDARIESEQLKKHEDGSLEIAQMLRLRRESQRRILLAREKRLLTTLQQLAQQALQKHFAQPVQLALHLPRARDW